MSQFVFALPDAPSKTKAKLKGRIDVSTLTEEQRAKHEQKKARDRQSAAKYKAKSRAEAGLLPAAKKVRIEAGPSTSEVEPSVPAITGVYCEKPDGYIQQEVLPDAEVGFDPRCPYAVWAGQYLTRLPYIPDPNNSQENALQTLSPHLRQLVYDARDARGSPYVDYYPYSEDVVELGRKIQASMAEGKMAVVEGCLDVHRIELSTSDLLRRLHIQPHETFSAHDMHIRETCFEAPQVDMTLTEFIESMKDPNIIRAILDSTTGSVECPTLVGHVDEGYIAVDKMKDLFQSLPIDMKSSRFWVIKHHPMFHTYVHHDASGTGTWTSIASGYKFWIKVVGKGELECSSVESLYQQYERYFFQEQESGQWAFSYAPYSERYCIFGKPGDMIFQPPNAWHEVYTPSKSVTVGGHFFSYDTVHFSDAGRRFDILRPGMTNQHHSSSQLTLSAMVLYMATRGPQTYRRKPLTSLCRMILQAHLYLCANEKDDDILGASIAAFINKNLPRNRRVSWPRIKGKAIPLQPVVQQAILMANVLVADLDLDFLNANHLFSPIPWTDPGEEVKLGEEVIQNMKLAVNSI